MKKIILPLALMAMLAVGAVKSSGEANPKPTVTVKPKTQITAPYDSSKTVPIQNSTKDTTITFTDYSDYYLSNAGFGMWVGAERGIKPFVSLNSGNFYGSGIINYNATDIAKDQSTAQLILNGGATINKIGLQAIGGLDVKKSNYSLDRNTNRLFALNNGNGREIEISTSNIDNTTNMFAFGASKKMGQTNIFSSFAQYIQMSKVDDQISNQYFSTTFDRDSTNQGGIPIVVETRANTNVYTDLESKISNKRKSSIFQMGFETMWGKLFNRTISSGFSSDISLNSSEAKQTLYGQSRTESYGNTRVIVNGDTTDVGFNSSTTTPIYAEDTTKAKDAHVGLSAVVGYDIPLGEKVRISATHRTPNQNQLIIDAVCPLVKYEKWNNQGAVFNGYADLSKESTEFGFGSLFDASFFGKIDAGTAYDNAKRMSNLTKRNLDKRRNLEQSIVHSDDARKLLAENLWSSYYQEVGFHNPFIACGANVDFKKPSVGMYGGYGDQDFSIIGSIATDGASITGAKNNGKNRPSLTIGYDKDKKAVYTTLNVGL